MYLGENGLDPLTYPSYLRLENELVSMIANLLGGDETVVGNFTTGGTESLILAVKAARDWARVHRPHIREPEFVLPITAHASFYKAAHYLGLKPVPVPVRDDSYLADVDLMRGAVTDNTVLLVASAPGYAHGVVDPIPEIGALALEKDLLLHIDACVGGIHLAYMRKLGYPVPAFNFKVPGVTSMSTDMHKYGYSAKPASVVLYRNNDLRKHQIFACSRWTGYTVINPTITSTKSAGPLAAAWAVVHFLGDEGYMKIVREVMEVTRVLVEEIRNIEGLRILGKPDMCMFSFTSTTEKLNIYRLADEMKLRGWFLQPQFGQQNSPANLHISLNRSSVPKAKELVRVLRKCVRDLLEQESGDETENLHADMMALAQDMSPETFEKLAPLAGVQGSQLPDRMEGINRVLDEVPDDITEGILIEFLNSVMVSET